MRRRFTMNKGFTETFDPNNYLTIEALEDNLTVTFTNNIEYGIDGKGWLKLKASSESQSISAGQTLSFRGNLAPNNSDGIGTFTINKKCNLKGNCMSMLFGDNAADNYSLRGKDWAFCKLFYNCSNIVNVSRNFLPAATTLANYCYSNMFKGCTSLTTAPTLPATTLANYCYYNMFNGCTSLTTAPTLPATTLASNCYEGMFFRCTSLTTAPELPATTLASTCYYKMFSNCTSLTTAPALPATTLTYGCYLQMLSNCTSLTTAPELPATTLANYCYNSMFSGCTSLTTSPTLPSTILANYCYNNMFQGCTKLTTAPALPATTLAMGCYYNMFSRCTSLTTAPELPANTLVDGCYQYMFYNCTRLNYIKCLATDISATNCTSNWVSGVASTGTFVKAADMTGWTTGTSGIPIGWTVEEYIDYTKEPLTFNILSAGTINWTASNTDIAKTIDYKLNGGEWVSITSNTGSSAPTITVNSGDKIQFRGDNTAYCGDNPELYNTFGGSTAEFEIEGNIMSLINSTDFSALTTLESNFTFTFLFSNCTGLTSAENLILPATPLTMGCYLQMFYGCSSLTTAPELPSTTLAMGCYDSMFYGCGSLTTAPELPATTLAEGCYSAMFSGCSSLTTAPELPATTLALFCYNSMFAGCTSLITATELPATTLADNCYSYMFQNCTSLTTAPELPAAILAEYCYDSMFIGCTSLNYIKCLATDISATDCTNGWVDGVASTGTFVKASSMTSWSTSPYGIPSGWTVQDA